MNKQTCCICGKPFYGFGNNPDPAIFDDYETGAEMRLCCDLCNTSVVVPLRVMRMKIGLPQKLTVFEVEKLRKMSPEEADHLLNKTNNQFMWEMTLA